MLRLPRHQASFAIPLSLIVLIAKEQGGRNQILCANLICVQRLLFAYLHTLYHKPQKRALAGIQRYNQK